MSKLRSIPACAGKPEASESCRSLQSVYPRMCGEAVIGCKPPGGNLGLSPHVRGSQLIAKSIRLNDRSIPACAGKPA